MAVLAVEELEPCAVRIHLVKSQVVIAAGVVPTGEDDLPVRQHRWIEIVVLVEGNLVDVGAVGIHHVEHECRLVAILILRGELRLAFIEQDRFRLPLAGG